jgi:hypothetical protein
MAPSWRVPVGVVSFDPAVGRIGRRPVDAGDIERAGVHPGAVMVPVRQEHRPVRDNPVEACGSGCSAWEGGHGPPAAENPRSFGVRLRVSADRIEVEPLDVVGSAQVAADALQASLDRVDVRIDESRDDEPACSIDDRGLTGRMQTTYRRHNLVVDDHVADSAEVGVPVEHSTVAKNGEHCSSLS